MFAIDARKELTAKPEEVRCVPLSARVDPEARDSGSEGTYVVGWPGFHSVMKSL